MNAQLLPALLAWLLFPALLPAQQSPTAGQRQLDWRLNQLERIGGHPTQIVGSPKLIAGESTGIHFNGTSDGLFLDMNPLQELDQFTVEVVFRPTSGGPKEQRFLHFQEVGSERRLLFETRLTADGQWFLDTFLKTNEGNHTLFADRSSHPIGPWYAAAVVVDGQSMRHYVNGVLELSMPIDFKKPFGPGQTSLGVRINKVSWYQGAIRQIRITPSPLAPAELLRP